MKMNKAIRALVAALRLLFIWKEKMYLSIHRGFIPTYLHIHACVSAATTICVYLCS